MLSMEKVVCGPLQRKPKIKFVVRILNSSILCLGLQKNVGAHLLVCNLLGKFSKKIARIVEVSVRANTNFHGLLIACDDETITTTGHITTPNYPKVFPANLECTQSIQFPINETIVLYFSGFDLDTDLFGYW